MEKEAGIVSDSNRQTVYTTGLYWLRHQRSETKDMKRGSCKSLRLTDLMEKWRNWKKGHFAVYTREGRRCCWRWQRKSLVPLFVALYRFLAMVV
ncbi:unnamed protein product [Arabis nemorensis]|uniref:Uncharacterized protein n=1 Tax=Arabis nemorensis TaxID=586526 RepID=A0A565ARE4_9BRAS|nr:unnamed protein product [Arabis nemorensis]